MECGFCETKLYSGLRKGQIREIRELLSHCNTGPGDMLFRAGDPSKYLYVIREGQVKLTRPNINGHDHLIGVVGNGYFLGFDTIGNPQYSYSAETLTPTVFCRIKHNHIVRLLREEPRVSLNLLLAVNEQLAQAHNLIRVLGQKTAVEKVAALLLSLIPPQIHGAAMPLHLSRIDLSELLGLTVETVSRIMAELNREGIIDAPRGHILIRARKRLRVLAGEPLHPKQPGKSGLRRRPGRPHDSASSLGPHRRIESSAGTT